MSKKQQPTLRQKLTKLTAKPADKYVLWIVLVLAAAGIVAVYSAISFLAETKAGGDTERFLLRHVLRLSLALGAIALFSVVDYHTLARWSRLALIVSLVLLVVAHCGMTMSFESLFPVLTRDKLGSAGGVGILGGASYLMVGYGIGALVTTLGLAGVRTESVRVQLGKRNPGGRWHPDGCFDTRGRWG